MADSLPSSEEKTTTTWYPKPEAELFAKQGRAVFLRHPWDKQELVVEGSGAHGLSEVGVFRDCINFSCGNLVTDRRLLPILLPHV